MPSRGSSFYSGDDIAIFTEELPSDRSTDSLSSGCHGSIMATQAVKDFNITTGALKEACGLPFATVVQPFARLEHLPLEQTPTVTEGELGRCQECYA